MKILNYRKIFQRNMIDEFNNSLIKEGLISSWDYNDLIRILNRKNYFEIDFDSFSLKIKILRNNITEDLINYIKSVLNMSGYNISYWKLDNGENGKGLPNNYEWFSDYNHIDIELNKKFDTELKGIPIYLFHVTEKRFLEKINKNGIYPKSLNKLEEHPDRVYVFDNLESSIYYANDLISRFDFTKNDLSILKIDTRLTNGMKLHDDPKFGDTDFGASYTYDHISPLSIINYIKL